MARGNSRANSELPSKSEGPVINSIVPSLEKVESLINIRPSVEDIKNGTMDKAVESANEALKFGRRALSEAEGRSTGNPNDKATMAYVSIMKLVDDLSKEVKEMKYSALGLSMWHHPDPKKQKEYRDDFEYYDRDFKDLQNDYQDKSYKVLKTIDAIKSAIKYAKYE